MRITVLVRHNGPSAARVPVKVTAFIHETALALNNYTKALVIEPERR